MIETYQDFVAAAVRPSGEVDVPLYPHQDSYVADRLSVLGQSGCAMTIEVPIAGPISHRDLVRVASALIKRHTALALGLRLHHPLTQFPTDPDPEEAVLGSEKPFASPVDLHEAASEIQWTFTGAAPLFRLGAAPNGNDRWLVVGVFHHATVDGISLDLLHRDISRLLAGDAVVPAAHLKASFADYCSWLGTLHDTPWWTSMRAYWKEHLDQLPRFETTEIGLHRIPADAETTLFALNAPASRNLLRSARTASIKPDAMLTARFMRGLSIATGYDDLSVTVPSPSRDHPAISQEVGFFASVIPVGARSLRDSSLDQLGRSIQRQLSAAHPNQIHGYAELLDPPLEAEAVRALGLTDVEINLTSIRLDRVIPELPPGEVVHLGHSGRMRSSMVLNVVFHARGAVLFMRSRTEVWSVDQRETVLRAIVEA